MNIKAEERFLLSVFADARRFFDNEKDETKNCIDCLEYLEDAIISCDEKDDYIEEHLFAEFKYYEKVLVRIVYKKINSMLVEGTEKKAITKYLDDIIFYLPRQCSENLIHFLVRLKSNPALEKENKE